MTKAVEEVIIEFNKLVNMSVEELEEFLKTEESQNAGWGEGEESVGHNRLVALITYTHILICDILAVVTLLTFLRITQKRNQKATMNLPWNI